MFRLQIMSVRTVCPGIVHEFQQVVRGSTMYVSLRAHRNHDRMAVCLLLLIGSLYRSEGRAWSLSQGIIIGKIINKYVPVATTSIIYYSLRYSARLPSQPLIKPRPLRPEASAFSSSAWVTLFPPSCSYLHQWQIRLACVRLLP